MNWLKNIMVFALVAVWPLAVNHCKLETVPGLAFLHSPVHTAGQGDCGADGCPTVESGSYRAEENQAPQASVMILPAIDLMELVLPEPPPAEITAFSFAAAPPEFAASRQFVFRTVAPPRAPSFAS